MGACEACAEWRDCLGFSIHLRSPGSPGQASATRGSVLGGNIRLADARTSARITPSMKKWSIAALMAALSICCLPAEERLSARLSAFFPAGSTAYLNGPEGPTQLSSGAVLELPPGAYELVLDHPGYRSLSQPFQLAPGAEVVLAPRMSLTLARRGELVQTYVQTREKVAKARNALIVGAVASGALSLAGAGLTGYFEWAIGKKKSQLEAEYAAYRQASASETAALWVKVEARKAEIEGLRRWEPYALGAASLFGAAGGFAAASAPGVGSIDAILGRLQKAARTDE